MADVVRLGRLAANSFGHAGHPGRVADFWTTSYRLARAVGVNIEATTSAAEARHWAEADTEREKHERQAEEAWDHATVAEFHRRLRLAAARLLDCAAHDVEVLTPTSPWAPAARVEVRCRLDGRTATLAAVARPG
jgi:hypothetical protein